MGDNFERDFVLVRPFALFLTSASGFPRAFFSAGAEGFGGADLARLGAGASEASDSAFDRFSC
jgi:hypothetical protein